MVEITEIALSQETQGADGPPYDRTIYTPILPSRRIAGMAKSDKPFVSGTRFNLGRCSTPRRYTIHGRANVMSTYFEREPKRISKPGPYGTAIDMNNPLHGLDYGCEFDVINPSRMTVIANA